MGDPTPDVDVAVDDAPPVARDEWETLPVRPSLSSWNVWIFERERRPRRLKDIRGKVAAITAGVIVGVLGLAGLISYGVTWVGRVDHASSLLTGNLQQVDESLLSSSPLPTDPQQFLDVQVARVDTPDGALGVWDDLVTSSTPRAARAAADEGLVADVVKRVDYGSGVTHAYTSPSSAYVYAAMPIIMDDGTTVYIVRVIDLTSERGRLNTGYLLYGLGSLAGAGAAGGAVWWGLGRRRNSTGEPDEV
jgi:hypothetical protein